MIVIIKINREPVSIPKYCTWNVVGVIKTTLASKHAQIFCEVNIIWWIGLLTYEVKYITSMASVYLHFGQQLSTNVILEDLAILANVLFLCITQYYHDVYIFFWKLKH